MGSQLADTGVKVNAGIFIYLTQSCQWDVITTVMAIIITIGRRGRRGEEKGEEGEKEEEGK